MRTMRIGFFHSDTFPFKDGGSVQSWQIAAHLQRCHQVYTIHSAFPDTRVLPLHNPLPTIGSHLDCIFIIVDGMLNFSLEKFSLYAFFAKKKIPVIWLLNAPLQESLILPWYDKSKFRRHLLLRHFLAKTVTASIVISAEVKKYATQTLKLKHTTIIPNGSDPNHFKPLSKPKETLLSKFKNYYKVIWAGNAMYPWQGIDLIVATARRFQKLDKKVLFFIIAGQSWTNIPALPNLVVIPSVDYTDLPDYLAQADVCLSLYHYNYDKIFYNSPMKLFDYMAMGKPIIASNKGQIKQIITDKVNGLLVSDKVEDIIAKIQYLRKNPVQAAALGKQARQDVIDYYNWDRVGEEVEKVIRLVTE